MKKIFRLGLLVSFVFVNFSSAFGDQNIEKTGFLTMKWCADKGMFNDCKAEVIFCGYEDCHKEKEFLVDPKKEDIVLYVHSEGKYYFTKFSKDTIRLGDLLVSSINRDGVTLQGRLLDEDTIEVDSFKAPLLVK
ncbi:MAG: hypothetical protein IE909_06250 [Campylobacterales bacterium]|nr:hypothetical protein [Campylobacterales bacterium]